MRTNVALPAGERIKNLRDTVTDVIAHDELDKHDAEENADHGIDKVEAVGAGDVKV